MSGRRVVVVLVFTLGFSLLAQAPAGAAPATPVHYPGNAATTGFSGLAFDTCTAPPVETMRAWLESPYRGVGVYLGGVARACSQRHLTPDWVRAVTAMRWRLIPIYVGRQAPCRKHSPKMKISYKNAVAQGGAAAKDAVAKAKHLGLLSGSVLYLDVETYPANKPRCRSAVLRFVSGWTRGLHRRGYLSGVYAPVSSGAKHLAETYRSTKLARPDALWIAHWDKKPSLTNWRNVPDDLWARAQRGKQFRGPHKEKHGGRALTIDSIRFAAPVATVARHYKITSGVPLKGRTGPSTKRKIVTSYPPGSRVPVVCQVKGAKVGPTRVWNKLSNGTFVSDRHVATPAKRGFSSTVPRCSYPFQVTAPEGLNKRKGPGTSHAQAGRVPTGALVRVVCQGKGTKIYRTRVWNKLTDGRWVSDHYVATPGGNGFSEPLRRC